MVFPASDAANLTTNSITSVNTGDVQLEITLAENKIRLAAANELFSITYDATIIGNPSGNPQFTSNLTPNQLQFYTLLVNAGYILSIDSLSGRWLISWAPQGPETQVRVYTFRTVQPQGAIHVNTSNAISAYFNNLIPTVHNVVILDGFIDEAGFGGTSSTFFEYTVVCDQGVDNSDHSAGLTTFMISQGLGYSSGNCATYRLV